MRTKPSKARPCIHFTGIQHETCKVGVNYRELTGNPEFGMALRLPCCSFMPSAGPFEKVTCAQQRPETGAEHAERDAETDRKIAEMLGVNKAVYDFEEENGGPLVGQERRMDCPQCGVAGGIAINRIPTRLYVYCSTPKCVGYEANLGGSVFD